MAWASTYVQPAAFSPQYIQDNAGNVQNPLSQVISPTLQGGGAFNCSALTGVTVTLDNGQSFGSAMYQTAALTSTSASPSSSGFTLQQSAANIQTAINAMAAAGASAGNIAVVGTDGTTSLVLAQGRWTLKQIP